MLLRISEERMIDRWLLRKGFEPLRSDCQISRSDGMDLRELGRTECRIWYEKLLREAPAELLAPVEMAKDSDIMLSSTNSGGIRLQLPDEVIRPVAVKLTSWKRAADIVDEGSEVARHQTNPYLCSGFENPVAVFNPLRKTLTLYSPCYNDLDILDTLLCIVRHNDNEGDPIYEFDETLIETLEPVPQFMLTQGRTSFELFW